MLYYLCMNIENEPKNTHEGDKSRLKTETNSNDIEQKKKREFLSKLVKPLIAYAVYATVLGPTFSENKESTQRDSDMVKKERIFDKEYLKIRKGPYTLNSEYHPNFGMFVGDYDDIDKHIFDSFREIFFPLSNDIVYFLICMISVLPEYSDHLSP